MWSWKRASRTPSPQVFDGGDIAALRQLAAQPAVLAAADVGTTQPAPPRSGPRSTQLNVRVHAEVRLRAQALAAQQSASLAEIVERAIDELHQRTSGGST